jgi:hypothetical protein
LGAREARRQIREKFMERAFVIRPFGKKKAKQKKDDTTEREIDFDAIHKALIGPALTAVGLDGGTTVDIMEAGSIREDMFSLILEGDVVVCDMTIHNANVFYELGIRHALRKKRTVLLKGGPVADEVPFDNLTDRYLAYNIDDRHARERQDRQPDLQTAADASGG